MAEMEEITWREPFSLQAIKEVKACYLGQGHYSALKHPSEFFI
jgi:hypothetical protein